MRTLHFTLLLLTAVGCNSSSETPVMTDEVDTISETKDQFTTADTIAPSVLDSNFSQIYEVDEIATTAKHLEKTYGTQWDFCDCIHKTDSIQKAIESVGEISDDEFDNLMVRFEEIDQHCKTLIASPNTSPDERRAHERKVKNCLKK